MKRKYILLLFYFFILCFGYAQTTSIPDENFEQALINQGIDTDGALNGQVNTADIESIITLNVQQKEILDLTGIEDFEALENLNASYNLLSSITITSNANLKILNIEENEMTNLDISQNSLLEELYVGNPEEDFGPFNMFSTINTSNNENLKVLDCYFLYGLTSLDLSQNTNLEILDVPFCDLETLDLSKNLNLNYIRTGFFFSQAPDFISNNLTEIDLSQNVNLEDAILRNSGFLTINVQNGANEILYLDATGNNDLQCILVDDEISATTNQPPYDSWNTPENVTFSETECVLSLEENEIGNFNVYPNPTSNVVTVSSTSVVTVNHINVFDITGKAVLKNKNDRSISMQELPVGVYFVQVRLENGDVGVKRVVKK